MTFMSVVISAITLYVTVLMPIHVIYHLAYGRKYYLFARTIPVECDGETYYVKTKCKNALDFSVELYTEHMGKDLPVSRDLYRLNGKII